MKTHNILQNNRSRISPTILFLALNVLCLSLLPLSASAETLLSQGFLTNSAIPAGSIVSLKQNSSAYVDATTVKNENNILGVVIASNGSQLSVTSSSNNQVQVVTNGVEQVLVSTINGNIAVGDPITASPLSGIGMKATSNVKVVGISQGTFPNSTASKQNYKSSSGQTQTADIGEIPVLVSVSYYYKQPNKTIIPAAIQNIANALAGKTVNALPIIISMGIFIVTLIIVVSIIYALIRSSIISIGRNPMSQAAVYRNVMELSALVIVILGVAIVAIYMILTRFS